MTAVLSLALSTADPVTVQAFSGHVHISFGATRLTIPADEAATLAADLLDAVGTQRFESVEVQS
jgi:hypothetical protein